MFKWFWTIFSLGAPETLKDSGSSSSQKTSYRESCFIVQPRSQDLLRDRENEVD